MRAEGRERNDETTERQEKGDRRTEKDGTTVVKWMRRTKGERERERTEVEREKWGRK